MLNSINTWAPGYFVDQKQYEHWSEEEKEAANKQEALKVRPSDTGIAICTCDSPEDSRWVANRLNLASDLEELCYKYATGKIDGDKIVKYVRQFV